MTHKKTFVISVGGSLIVPGEIDSYFLVAFKSLITYYVGLGYKFAIICGGGKTARHYQNAAKKVVSLSQDDVDWLGIHSTRLNAHLVRTIFREVAHPKIVKDPTLIEWQDSSKGVLVAAGWKPGCSTDFDAVLIAEKLGAKVLINLSNIDYVYDKDPRKNKDAKPIKNITWKEFRKLIPAEWNPGLSSPFDPIASREAERLQMEVVILNGSNLSNVAGYLDGKKFTGTTIH